MRTLTIALILVSFAAVGCKKKDEKDQTKQPPAKPVPTQPDAKNAEPVATPTPPPAADPGFDKYAADLLAALGKKDKAAFAALALSADQVKPMFEAAKNACPDKIKKQLGAKSIDDAAAEMAKQLGTKEDRAKKYAGYFDACVKVVDFSKAKLTKATPKDVKMECGGGRADNLVIEADVAGKPVYIFVDDPIKTPAGWRAPEEISCSTTKP